MSNKSVCIERADVAPDGQIRVELRCHGDTDGAGSTATLQLPLRWVRDHSEDPASLDPASRQRLVDTFAIPGDLVVEALHHTPDALVIEWADGEPSSRLTLELLSGLAMPSMPRRETWGVENLPDLTGLPNVADVSPWRDADAVLHDDQALLEWLDDVDARGFGLVRGLDTTGGAAEQLARRVGPIRATIFGEMWTLASDLADHADSAYSETFLEPHTDGSYSHDSPGTQMFACMERSGTGGESILVDGFDVAERLRREAPEYYGLLTRVAVPGQYIEPGVHLRAERTTISVNSRGLVRQLTFNNYDRAPFLLDPEEMTAWYEAYGYLHELINDRSHWRTIRLDPGDVVLFDNWRTLHGRMAYTGTRVFEGCYHAHEDFESRLRVLQAVRPAEDGH